MTHSQDSQPTLLDRDRPRPDVTAEAHVHIDLLDRVAAEGAARANTLSERIDLLDRVAAEGAARTNTLSERIDLLDRVAAEGAARANTLSERIDLLDRVAAEGAARANTLSERIDLLDRVAAEGAARANTLSERIDLLDRVAAEQAYLSARVGSLTRAVERTRTRLAVPDSVVIELEEFRSTPEYARIYEEPEPLVSVIIATYNRAELLVERCLRSVIDQDYTNIEIIVVGDGCTDDTEARVRAIADDRIVYREVTDRTIPARIGEGTDALNQGRAMARGALLTHLDDDDEYSPDRIGRLVRFLQETKAELAWHPFWWQEDATTEWEVNDADALEFAKVTTGAVIYLAWLKRIEWDALTLRYGAPGDWSHFRTLRDIGVRARRYPVPLLRHYLERQNPRLRESGDDAGRPTTSALQRFMPLVPDVRSRSDYEGLLGHMAPWVRAVVEIAARVGISSRGTLRLEGDVFPTLTTAGGHVVTLYGPWNDGASAFARAVDTLRTFGRVSRRQVPKLLASGALDEDWSYTVTTEIPGVRLSTIRDQLSEPDRDRVARWLSGVVTDLHATPLSAEERAHGWASFCATIADRHERATVTFTERSTLPPHLVAQIDGWMPPLASLLAREDLAVMLHADLDDEVVVGIWHAGVFDPTGLVGLGSARIGHPYYELGGLVAGVFRDDAASLEAFLRRVGWPGTASSDFPRLALAFIMLDDRDRLRGLAATEDAKDLDDLAMRLFAGARDPHRA